MTDPSCLLPVPPYAIIMKQSGHQVLNKNQYTSIYKYCDISTTPHGIPHHSVKPTEGWMSSTAIYGVIK